ncbi:hypothetical protein NQZ68_036521 [Dissostichus eleginoides]|nr:hypothetical protein NQZ68_036521 [Dissostichus eleginoides]
MPLSYAQTQPNSLAALAPSIPVSSSPSLRGTAELFIKQTSGIRQSPGQSRDNRAPMESTDATEGLFERDLWLQTFHPVLYLAKAGCRSSNKPYKPKGHNS